MKPKLKYYLSNKLMLAILAAAIIILILLSSLVPVHAETIYVTSPDKTVQVSNDLCIKYLADCNNAVYLNGYFLGYYKNSQLIEVPDGSDLLVVLDDPINTNLDKAYDTGKTGFTIAIMTFIQPIIIILIIYLLIMFTIRRYRRKR